MRASSSVSAGSAGRSVISGAVAVLAIVPPLVGARVVLTASSFRRKAPTSGGATLAAFSRYDFDIALERFHPDAVLEMADEDPLAEKYVGRERIKHFWTSLFEQDAHADS